MKRREFLASIGAIAGVAAFAPAALLSTPTLPGATGNTISTSGWSTEPDPLEETLCVGDVFTIAGYYAFNPQTYKPTKHLQSFVVTGIDGATVNIHPHHEGVNTIKAKRARKVGK